MPAGRSAVAPVGSLDALDDDSTAPAGVDPQAEPPAESGADEVRHPRIAERAYRLAERRGVAPGADLDDWLAAEVQERDSRGDV